MSGRTVLLDGHSLAHRAYHALPPTLTSPSGVPTNAVLGFCNMLIRIMEMDGAERVVCAFDSHGPVFRHEDFADYKATRKPMDQELRVQIPLIKDACRAFGIEVVELPGFEADDLLGTMARKLEKAGKDVAIVTSDRDSYQLASDRVKLLMTKKGISDFELMGPDEVKAACGVEPRLVPDLKGLIGDTSDNIPGVRGIGEKGAVRLITEYGSLEGILEAEEPGKPDKAGELVRQARDIALLSKKLATIDTEAPIDFDPARVREEADSAILMDFLAEMGFKSLMSKFEKKGQKPKKEAPAKELFGAMPPTASLEAKDPGDASYKVKDVSNLLELADLARKAAGIKSLSIDFISEGKGWEAIPRRLLLGLDGIAYDVAVDAEGSLIGGSGIELKAALEALAPALDDEGTVKCGWDIKGSSVIIGRSGFKLKGITFDPMLAGFLLNPLGRSDSPQDILFRHFRLLPSQIPAERPHEARLAVAALMGKLRPVMESELHELGMQALFAEVEMPLVEVLACMETEGVKVDIQRLRDISSDMRGRLDVLEQDIYRLGGGEFNIGSPKQLGAVLFEKLGLPADRKTKTGYSTDADVLEGLMPLHPIVGRILEYRGISKLKSTYVDVLPELASRQGGRIHTTFNQTGAVTGRLSSSDPNMQNIPIKSEEGLEIRAAFTASPGNLIVSADYSQIELRLLAHLSGDPVLIEAFRLGQDVHTRTAAEVFGVPMDSVSREMRYRAKTVNFGIIYGQSEFGLSKTLGIPQAEAKEFIERYFRRYMRVKQYFSEAMEKARSKGYVSTIMGRRRSVPELYSANFNMRKFGERIVMNAPIQGSAADIIKVAMIRLQEKLEAEGWKSRLILQVHDELVIEAPKDEAEGIAAMVKAVMEGAVPLSVPLIAEAGIGANWKEAK